MRVCTQCGKENIAHLVRHPQLCPHEYEDIIAGLKDALRNANKKVGETIAKAVKNRNQSITQRNKQIGDLKRRLIDAGKAGNK